MMGERRVDQAKLFYEFSGAARPFEPSAITSTGTSLRTIGDYVDTIPIYRSNVSNAAQDLVASTYAELVIRYRVDEKLGETGDYAGRCYFPIP